MEPTSDPNRSHLVKSPKRSLSRPNHVLLTVIKPLNVIKLTVNQTPTTKNVIKFTNGVNNFIKVRCKKNTHRQPYPDTSMEKAKPYPDSTAVRVQNLTSSDADSILNISDADPNHSNVRLLCVSNQPTIHSDVLRVSNQSRKQPTSDIDPQVASVVHPPTYNINSYSRKLQMNKKYTVIKNTVLIPCTKKKLPASVRVHFSTTSTTLTVPET